MGEEGEKRTEREAELRGRGWGKKERERGERRRERTKERREATLLGHWGRKGKKKREGEKG